MCMHIHAHVMYVYLLHATIWFFFNSEAPAEGWDLQEASGFGMNEEKQMGKRKD